MKYLLCILMCYLIGTLNPAFVLGKIKGIDVKKKGTLNAGASNAFILMGKAAGGFVLFFDAAKAILAIKLSAYLFPIDHVFALAAVSCFLGHVFPFYMKFNGGKGTSCLIGIALAYSPLLLLIYAVVFFTSLLFFDYVIGVPIIIGVSFPFVYYAMSKDIIGAALLVIMPIVSLWKHKENFIRLKEGTEAKFTESFKKKKQK